MAAQPLIVIIGPTASGKTGLAIELAKRFNGEIIAADSRTVYREMDIGTAKPTVAEMNDVPHHMLNLVNVDQKFTLKDFQSLAKEKISEIRDKGKTPFLVGGSGLYIDAIIYDYKLPEKAFTNDEQKNLEKLTVGELQELLISREIPLPKNVQNRRHLINSLLRGKQLLSRRDSVIPDAVVVGITADNEILEQRIRDRAKQMLEDGLIDEARKLIARYGLDCEPLRRNSYGEIVKYMWGDIADEKELLERIVIVDRQLAKKQMTWWRNPRHSEIKWLSLDEAREFISSELTKIQNHN
ncbi:tRNA (adenosine(37)-N6)-dimethylallyltransferase MiaA [Candidatus Saccharibacteria bacterium]|nr:tRNA (adenosine(37)-N6)-dimethylallyltransferase MiaA [Candidatus Saccharibacteria bacterium]